MNFARSLAAAVSIAAAFAAAAAPASAGAIGAADLAINNLVMTSNGVAVGSAISFASESRSGSAAANFNGIEGTGAGAASKNSFGVGATVDVGYRCGGPGCSTLSTVLNPENNFGTNLTAPIGNFTLADMIVQGKWADAASYSALTRADASAAFTGTGGANGTALNTATTSAFTAATTLTASFDLGYNAYVAAIVQALQPGETGIAAGAIGWSLSLSEVGGANLLTWSPAQLNIGFTSTNPSQNSASADAGTISSALFTLTAGHSYLLQINQSSNAVVVFNGAAAAAVPEPASILLLAMGLLALVAATRRRTR